MRNIKYLAIIVPLIILTSCGLDEHEAYSTPFVHIMKDETAFTKVTPNSNFVATYNIYLSSAPLTQNLEVEYEIIVGDGLKAGRDYEIITTGNKLLFMPGIYDMPIRIRWMPYPVDPTKQNTLTIKIVSNSMNFNIGLPGPDHLQSSFTITKAN